MLRVIGDVIDDRSAVVAVGKLFDNGIGQIVSYVEDIVTTVFKTAWDWIISFFRKPNMPNMFVAGDPNVLDEVAYKQTVTRTTSKPYAVDYMLKHESQTITAISVLPIREDLQAPEVDIIEGGINFRKVSIRLTPVEEGQWGCDIKICGSPAPQS